MTDHRFADDDRPRAISDVEVAPVDGGILVLDESARSLHHLDGLAASVWLLCDGATPVGSMAGVLSELSEAPITDLAVDVQMTLDELAGSGLLAGVDVLRVVAVPEDELFAPDGSRIVQPPRDACGPDADTSVWKGSIVLRVGPDRDRLLAVRGDSAATLERLRALFAEWLEPHPPEVVFEAAALFSVWLTPLEDQAVVESSGIRTLPQLRRGSTVMTRSRRPDEILAALALAVGVAHVQRPDDGRTWVGLRPFALGERLVLTDIDRPEMVNDPKLAALGVFELAAWAVVVESDGSVSVPPSLPGLEWPTVGIEAPSDGWRRYRLAGVVSMRRRHRGQAELIAKLVRHGVSAAWFRTVAAMVADGTAVHSIDGAAARDEIVRLLG